MKKIVEIVKLYSDKIHENCLLQDPVYIISLVPFFTIKNDDEWLKFGKPVDIYFVSDDTIKNDDWYINLRNPGKPYLNRAGDTKFDGLYDGCKKIIATTNPNLKSFPRPSNKFLKKYCMLGGIDKAQVEYEEYHGLNTTLNEIAYVSAEQNGLLSDNYKDPYPKDYKLKIINNIISIKSVKDKWTKDEVVKLLLSLDKNVKQYNSYFTGVKDFINENL